VNEILRYTVKPAGGFKVCNALVTNPYGTILSRTRQCVAYADDVLILGRWVREIEVEAQIKCAAVGTGLVINKSKIKHIKINRYIQIDY
jgi:hypothetical protein